MFDVSRINPVSPAGGAGERPIAVNMPSTEALMTELERCLRTRQGFTLATLNLDHLVKIGRDPAFRAAYARHKLITADGNPIVWLCRLAGQDVSLVPGANLVEPVVELATQCDVKVAFLGSTPEALDAAAGALATRHPGLQIAAQISPQMGFDPEGPEAASAIEALRASGAGLVFLALGAPKQEIFAARAQEALPWLGFLSIGAGLDFLAGTQTRAPELVQRLALEWLWRLLQNPGRLARRYLACFAILPRAGVVALKSRYTRSQEGI